MNDKGMRRLEDHRIDHTKITGQPFEHFFCPMLFVDEDVELTRGHVINKEFKGAPGIWAVQRTDVDNFFGRVFEGDFLLLQRLAGKRGFDLFFDKVLFKRVRPKIYFEGKELHYFLRFRKDRGKEVPDGFLTLDIDHEGQEAQVCIRNDGLTDAKNT